MVSKRINQMSLAHLELLSHNGMSRFGMGMVILKTWLKKYMV